MNWLLFWGLIVIAIATDALGDSLRKSHKKIAHLVELLGLLLIAFLAFLTGFLHLAIGFTILTYLLARIALFSLFWNIFSKQPLTYLGNTDITDILLNKFLVWTKFPRHFLLIFWALNLLASFEIVRKLIFN